MPIELNNQQVLFIEAFLSSKGLEYIPLQEELLNHLCCMVELKIAAGNSFHVASKEVFDAFGKDEIKELQHQTIQSLNQKTLTMKKVSFLVLGLLLSTFTIIWAINTDPPSASPLGKDYKISSPFGMRMHPVFKEKKMHLGVDIKAPIGTPVYATSDGVVDKVITHKGGYGNHILIKHDDSFQSMYAQLSEIKVEAGQKIKKGDLIGLVGSSGTSTAPHLHYEVIKNGKKVDPVEFFKP
ncbi:MAG: murein DD-endopeptidase MepM/ murein hydrolase activator NlpD [Saprospiraceae bacterium]|jgi:murein DD-endopeptidase MepM/ murein hydrolase activator NlpD